MGFEEWNKGYFLRKLGNLERLHENKTTKVPQKYLLKNGSNLNRGRREDLSQDLDNLKARDVLR